MGLGLFNKNFKTIIMAVKNTETGEVHVGYKGGETGCGFDTSASHWVNSNERITCDRNGCKN